jgi:hypothetical protein
MENSWIESRNLGVALSGGELVNHDLGNFMNSEAVEFPGFRVALAIASLPGMTSGLCNELQRHQT